MAYVRDNIVHSTGIDDKVVFSQSLHTWNPKYAPMVGAAGKVVVNPLLFQIAMSDAQSNIARFAEKVNLTGISAIKLKANTYNNYAMSMFVSENGSGVTKSVSVDQTTPSEFTLDVSDLTGEYYICFSALVGKIYEVALE